MPHYISKNPMIAAIPPESQKERLDTFFYHHLFADLDQRLEAASKELIPAENASSLITDGTHQTPTYTEKDNGVLFLSSTNIAEYGVDLSECKYIISDLHKRLKNCQPKAGDVLIAKSGTVGTACVFPEGLPECSVYESVAILRPSEGWNSDYIAAFINSDLGIRQIQRSQKGIAIKHLHLGDLKELWFPKIEEEAQKTLVSRIGFVANIHKKLTSECNRFIQKEHQRIWQKIDQIFADEFGLDRFVIPKGRLCFLRNPDSSERLDVSSNHPDYIKLVDQIKVCANSGVLSDLVEVAEDRFNPDEHIGEEVGYLAIGDIDGISGKIISPQIGTAQEIPSQMRLKAKENELVVAVTASIGSENMVVYRVRKEDEILVFSSDMKVLRPKDLEDSEYLQYLLKAPFVLRQIYHLKYGAVIKRISTSDLLGLPIPVTNSNTRAKTLLEIKHTLSEGDALTKQFEKINSQIQQLLSEAKSNIFDLLDDDKFSAMSAKAKGIEEAMAKIEEALQ